MGDLSLIVLTTNSKDGAVQALDAAKRLDRDGWIELMDYVLFKKDEKGHVTAREMDDEFSDTGPRSPPLSKEAPLWLLLIDLCRRSVLAFYADCFL